MSQVKRYEDIIYGYSDYDFEEREDGSWVKYEDYAAMEQRAEAAEAKLAVVIPEALHPSTAELVMSFATALAEKLLKSEQKYGWSDGWKDADWKDKCLSDFQHHITKGDPRDVAAYCTFMWYHGWETRPVPGEQDKQEPVVEITHNGPMTFCHWFKPIKSLPDNCKLYARPAPAINLADLVPEKFDRNRPDYDDDSLIDIMLADGFDMCRTAILRNIEEAK